MSSSLILKFTISDIPVHDSNWFIILGTLALAQTWKTLTQQRKTRIGDTSEAGVYLNHLAPGRAHV